MNEKQKNPSITSPGVPPARPAAAPPDKLKAERVQLRVQPQPQRLTPERVQWRLTEMPGWQVANGGRGIARVREFPTSRLAGAYVGFLAQFAASAGQSVGIVLAGTKVATIVRGEPRHGLTEAALDFAQALG